MSAHQTQLGLLFFDAFRHFEQSRPLPDIDVRYYPYAGLHHTISAELRLRGCCGHARFLSCLGPGSRNLLVGLYTFPIGLATQNL